MPRLPAALDWGDLIEGVIALLIMLGSLLAGGVKMLTDRKDKNARGTKAKSARPVPPPIVAPSQNPLTELLVPAKPKTQKRETGKEVVQRTHRKSAAKKPTVTLSASLPPHSTTPTPMNNASMTALSTTVSAPQPERDSHSAARRISRSALRRAVLMSELLAPPLALRDSEGRF